MGEWAALAEEIAEAVREPGFGAAAAVASSWTARVDPLAVRNLSRLALVLTDGEARASLWDPLPPCPDAAMLLTWGEDLESHLGDLLKRCMDAGTACRAEHDAAVKARAAAQREARRLEHAVAAAPEKNKAALIADLEAARKRARDAARVIADCEEALDTLGAADSKLRFGLDCARAFPADYADVYEPAERLVVNGGKMPHSGDFISPSYPAENATEAA